jgi:hypothetical protein
MERRGEKDRKREGKERERGERNVMKDSRKERGREIERVEEG